MKKWIFVLLALLVLLAGFLVVQSNSTDAGQSASEPGKLILKGLVFNTDLAPALEAAKAQGKPVFVYVRSEYCGWCKKFEAETFTNQSVIDRLNENFTLVSIDVDRQKKETRDFGVYGTPTEIFLYPNSTEMMRIRGYTDNETFLNAINEIAKWKEAKK